MKLRDVIFSAALGTPAILPVAGCTERPMSDGINRDDCGDLTEFINKANQTDLREGELCSIVPKASAIILCDAREQAWDVILERERITGPNADGVLMTTSNVIGNGEGAEIQCLYGTYVGAEGEEMMLAECDVDYVRAGIRSAVYYKEPASEPHYTSTGIWVEEASGTSEEARYGNGEIELRTGPNTNSDYLPINEPRATVSGRYNANLKQETCLGAIPHMENMRHDIEEIALTITSID